MPRRQHLNPISRRLAIGHGEGIGDGTLNIGGPRYDGGGGGVVGRSPFPRGPIPISFWTDILDPHFLKFARVPVRKWGSTEPFSVYFRVVNVVFY